MYVPWFILIHVCEYHGCWILAWERARHPVVIHLGWGITTLGSGDLAVCKCSEIGVEGLDVEESEEQPNARPCTEMRRAERDVRGAT